MNILQKIRSFASSAPARAIKEATTTWTGCTMLVLAYLGAKTLWNLDVPTFPTAHVVAVVLAWGIAAGLGEYRAAKRRVPDAVTVFAANSFVDCPICSHNQIQLNEVVCASCDDLGAHQSLAANAERNTRMETLYAIVAAHQTR
ncbi:hypothetical protein [Stackebrandtia nassauensis]|uniref:Uncharacterized protein n=1 Tax=Stackebrandtia nassauensis (strain DSM 44728 / CIP 108903 / NRRL B-16338 / NBRC 102104 / LLR-40K-21) TaxID=446470 RepID=D3Q2X0_STANL|nr:hypothetical protein [Stackebrandtia nassauensis]ADD45871.1 hypothetical protein Snas_6251 [Stackebrandtia nassauensis DSM 44728]